MLNNQSKLYLNQYSNQHSKKFRLVKMSVCAISLFSGLLSAANVTAAPSSNVVWTAETRNLLKNADLENGKKIARKCSKCHGVDGADLDVIEEEDTPYLAGQVPHASYKQLVDYQDKSRDDKTMRKKVKKLSKQDLADVSVYYSKQALPLATVPRSKVTPEAVQLAEKGAGDRFIPPCAGCHGLKGEGSIVDIPALAGQSASYFVTTMLAYREDDRENDIYSRMRFIAKELTEDEITELADYYAAIGELNPDLDELEDGDEATEAKDGVVPPAVPVAPKAPEAPEAPESPTKS